MGLFDTLANFVLSPFEAGLDSLGLSRHGRDMAHQEGMAREQMLWQSGENQKNRDFSLQMYEQQLQDYLKNYPELLKQQADTQFGVWSKQFAAENAFNSPAAQLLRLRGAGQNPVSSDGLTAGVNSMSGGSSVAPPPQIHGSPLGGSASPVGIPQGMSESLLRDVGGFLKDIAQAKKFDKETSRYDEMATSVINKYKSDSALADVQAAAQDIHNTVDKAYLEKETKERINRIITEAEWFVQRGETEKAEQKLKEAQEQVERTKNSQLIEQFPIVKENLIKEGKLLDEKRKTEQSQQSENYSQANLNNANKELADIAIKVKNAESTPEILAQKSRTILTRLERDESISKKDAEEARRRIEKLEGIKRTRENAGFVSRAVDDFFSWWTDHISTAVTGGVHASVSDNNSHSSVKYE